MTSLIISIVSGLIGIALTIIKCSKWIANKIQDEYKESMENNDVKNLVKDIAVRLDHNSNGTKALLSYRLRSIMIPSIKSGCKYSDEFEDVIKMFTAYTDLGGNGTIEQLYREYCNLPIIIRSL